MHNSPWFIRAPAARGRLRLYCFSYAGGSAGSYLPWQAALGREIELCAVQLPGRGGRLAEAPLASLRQLVGTLAAELRSHVDRPFAFFGHSLGALVAFELVRQLRMLGSALPRQLIVSGCEAPHRRQAARALHTLPDAELIEALRGYNGTPPEVLAHRELMALLLPAVRADFSMAETYSYQQQAPLALPLTVLAGRGDEYVDAERVEAWRHESSASCEVHWFQGDHFFLHSEQAAVLACLRQALEEVTPAWAYQA